VRPLLPLGLLLLGTTVFHVASMPKQLYPGDSFAVRAAAASLVTTGNIGIGYDQQPALRGFLGRPGQYLYENDAKRRFFSKYGIGYTLLFVPPLLIERAVAGRLDLVVQNSDSLLPILALYGVLLGVVSTLYLYRIVALYSERTWLRVTFVLLSFYATYLWHYLRAPALECFQIPAFLGFYFHAACFVRARSEGPESDGLERDAWRQLLAATLWCGVLLSMKYFFALSLAALWTTALLAGRDGARPAARLATHVRQDWKRYLRFLVLPSVLIGLALLSVNHYKFGSPLETGYGQWLNESGVAWDHFALNVFPGAFLGAFVIPGNGNVFVHYPLLIFALAGLPRFVRRRPQEAMLLGLVALSGIGTLLFFSSWRGEWGYGPRYFIFFLIVAALPFVDLCEWLLERGRGVVRFAGALLIALVVAGSVSMQLCMNSLHYFTYYYLEDLFAQARRSIGTELLSRAPAPQRAGLEAHIEAQGEVSRRYFQAALHRGLIHADLIAFERSGRPFPPLRAAQALLPPGQRDVLVEQLRPHLRRLAKSNYYFGDRLLRRVSR
jgi:hypothetical protein